MPALALVVGLGSTAPVVTGTAAGSAAVDPEVSLVVDNFSDPQYLGRFLTIRFQAHNNHTSSLFMAVSVALPAGLTVTSTFPACPTFPNDCSLGLINPGSLANLDVRMRVDAVIDATASGTVVGESQCPIGIRAAAACAPIFTNTGSVRVRTFASPVALSVAVSPQPGWVGGDPLTATYTIRNVDDSSLTDVVLTPGLPAQQRWTSTSGCPPPPGACIVGTIPPFGSVTRTYTLRPSATLTAPINALVTAVFDSCNDGCDTAAQATAVSRVLIAPRPVLTLSPALGPPGFVTTATGTGFPNGATVRLTWVDPSGQPLLTEVLTPTVVNGGFSTQVLIFRRDQEGDRDLVAEWVSGARFAPVRARFLVVPDTWVPPLPMRG